MPTDPLQLKYPIILVHGLGARSTYGPFEYFYGLPSLLKNAKNQIFIPSLTPWQTIEYRAQELKNQIEEAIRNKQIPDRKLNLVGHSMGGLDIRYLASQLNFEERIASVTTIGTPHRGTTASDFATDLLPALAFNAVDIVLKRFASNSGALKQLTRRYYEEHLSDLIPDQPKIAYFSASSAIRKPVMVNSLPVFWPTHRILSKHEGDNDGFVSVESAKWGEHICTYLGDHYAQIGQILGRARGMDYIQFYRDIFRHLKKRDL